MIYDYIIIGGGPCGLTIANTLSKKFKILIIDKNNSLGGCHRVKRIKGLFSEHSPRVYSNSYLNFIKILKDMNINFYDLFTKYKFGSITAFKKLNKYMTIKEYIIFIIEFLKFNDNNLTVNEFMVKNKFNEGTKYIINSLCYSLDGVDSTKFLLYSLFHIINNTSFYNLYIPKYPNDMVLFKLWYDYLVNNNVDILLNSKVTNIIDNNNIIINNNQKISGKNFIFACPPVALCDILISSNYPYLFGNIYKWSQDTKYIKYIPMTFHYNNKLKLKSVWGIGNQTEWGIIFIIMSDYMNFNDDRSKTVISITLSKPPINKDNIIEGTFKQLQKILPDLPYPDNVVLENSEDISFASTKLGYMNYKSKIFNNFYTCGHHIGQSDLSHNILESAVINGLNLCKNITDIPIIIYNPIKLLNILKLIIIIFILYFVYLLYRMYLPNQIYNTIT